MQEKLTKDRNHQTAENEQYPASRNKKKEKVITSGKRERRERNEGIKGKKKEEEGKGIKK